MVLVSIDPGLHNCGVAVWSASGELLWAGLVRNPTSKPGDGALAARSMAAAVKQAVAPWTISKVVCEIPQVYPGFKGGNPKDLIDLAAVVGGVLSQLPGDQLVKRPREWGGQVPKSVKTARTRKALTNEETSRIASCPASLEHNVWDAIAIGLSQLPSRKG